MNARVYGKSRMDISDEATINQMDLKDGEDGNQ
jgi:hypothetical protein